MVLKVQTGLLHVCTVYATKTKSYILNAKNAEKKTEMKIKMKISLLF